MPSRDFITCSNSVCNVIILNMEQEHVCPWWLGYTLILPIRRLQHDPQKILAPHVKPGMIVMDYGCAMGYFSIPLARRTGSGGKVYCVDIQEKMLAKLKKRAVKLAVADIIVPLQVGKDYRTADLQGKLDFALLFAVVHEVPDKAALFADMFAMLKPGGRILFVEPQNHVTAEEFRKSIAIARDTGLKELDEKPLKKGLAVLLVRK